MEAIVTSDMTMTKKASPAKEISPLRVSTGKTWATAPDGFWTAPGITRPLAGRFRTLEPIVGTGFVDIVSEVSL
jgi:hypothetical protein